MAVSTKLINLPRQMHERLAEIMIGLLDHFNQLDSPFDCIMQHHWKKKSWILFLIFTDGEAAAPKSTLICREAGNMKFIFQFYDFSPLTWWRYPQKYLLCRSIFSNSEITRATRTPAFWDTPRCPMITYTSDSHQIPSQNKTKSKLYILKNCQKFTF